MPTSIPLRALAFLVTVFCMAAVVPVRALPIITQQPASVTVSAGQSATLTVAATGSGTVTYQWRHLGSPISGAQSAQFRINAVELANAGFYDVVVGDGTGPTTSAPALLGLTSTAATGSYRLDPLFAPLVTTTYVHMSEANPRVHAIASLADGRVYVAGNFVLIGGARRLGLARFDASLTLDPTFAPEVVGEVFAVLVQPDGRILIGGRFTHAAGALRNNIARLNADGSLDAEFDPGNGFDDTVRTLALQSDGRVLVGGTFTSCDGTLAHGVTRLLATGAKDPAFDNGSGWTGGVQSLAVQDDGKIVLAGSFRIVAGGNWRSLARLEVNGTLDSAFAPAVGSDSVVIQPDGKILLSGCRLKADGTLDPSFTMDPAVGGYGSVAALQLAPDGKIYVAGHSGVYVARLHSDGRIDSSYNPASSPYGPAQCLSLLADGRLLCGGFLPTASPEAIGGLVRYAASGVVDGHASGPIGVPGIVNDLVPAPGGKWYIVGAFSHVNGSLRNRIARLNADGSVDLTFDPGSGFSGETHRVAVTGEGKVLVGGSFDSFNGVNRSVLVRLLPTGALDETFHANAAWQSLSIVISKLLLQPDGKVLVAGDLRDFGSLGRSGLVRLNADGTPDAAFNAGYSPSDDVFDVALQLDGRILVGGLFYSPNAGLVRLLPDGTLDTAFAANGISNGRIYAITVQSDQRILIGGEFETVNGVSRKNIARLLSSGEVDTTFDPGTGFNSTVSGLLYQTDGHILASGGFSSFNGAPCQNYARLATTGTFDPSFRVFDCSAYANLLDPIETGDGRVLVVNDCAVRAGHPQYGAVMLKIDTPAAPILITSPANQVAQPGDTVVFSVTATGDYLEYQWFKDGIAIVGADRSSLSIPNVTPANLGSFTVRVSNALGSLTSLPVTISGPHPAPSINSQPASTTVTGGTTAVLLVGATGVGPLTYQWRRLGVPIPGVTTSALSFAPVKMVDAAFYDVVICDGLSRTISQAAQLQVAAPLSSSIYRMDTSFAPYFSREGALVAAVAVAPDRSVVVGGAFLAFMGQPRQCLARVNALMELDTTFHPSADGQVQRVLIQSDGKILITGQFSHIDGVARNGLARLNPDGSLDLGFAPVGALDDAGFILTVALQPDGKILVGCVFSDWDVTGRAGLVRLLPTGQPDPSFGPSSQARAVSHIVVAPDGKIYVAGGLAILTPSTELNVLRLNSDGSVDPGFVSSSVLYSQGAVALALQPDGKIVVANPYSPLVRYNIDGTVDPNFNATGVLDGEVNALFAQADGKMVVGCAKSDYAPASHKCLVRLNVDGSADTTYAAANPDRTVAGLSPHPDGGVVVCGEFTHIGTAPAAGVGRFSQAGVFLVAPLGCHGSPGEVTQVLSLPDNRWLVAGAFTHVGLVPRAGMAVLKIDGSVDSSFDPGAGFAGQFSSQPPTIASMVCDAKGRVLIVGDFVTYQKQACPQLVRLLPSGAIDPSFTPNWNEHTGILKLGPRGEIYAWTSRTIFRLLESGAVDPTFQHAPNDFTYWPRCFGVLPDNRLVFGAASRWVSGAYAGYGRLKADGSLDDSFNLGAGADQYEVNTMLLQPDGSGIFAGNFSSFSGQFTRDLVHFSTSGAVDRTFSFWPVIPSYGAGIYQVLPMDGDRLLVLGMLQRSFDAPLSFPFLHRLESNWQMTPIDVFDVSATSALTSTEVVALADGRLLLRGVRAERGSVHANGLVMLKPETESPAPRIVSAPQGGSAAEDSRVDLSVTAVGTGPLSYQWFKDTYVIEGARQPTLTLSSAQLWDTGSYEVTVSNDFGYVTSAPVQLHVTEAFASYGAWVVAGFTLAERAEPAISGPGADPDGVGLSNLLRYAFKLPARGPLTDAPVRVMPPSPNYTGDQFLTIVFERNTSAQDLRYLIEASDSPGGPWSVIETVLPGLPETVFASDNRTIAGNPRRFLRVRVELVP